MTWLVHAWHGSYVGDMTHSWTYMRYKFIFNCEYIVYSQYTHSCTQYTATHCNALQHTATQCNTLQHTATNCTTLQHTTTHYILCIHNILTVVHNINTQYYSWMSHVTYVRIMSHMNIHCVTYTHIWDINLYLMYIHEWVTTPMYESCHAWMSHVIYYYTHLYLICEYTHECTFISHLRGLPLFHVCTCEKWLIHVWHDSCIGDMTHALVTWLIHVWHASLTCEMPFSFYTQTHMHMYTHARARVCAHTHSHTHSHTHIDTCVHTYTHTHAHTHTYTMPSK